VAAVQQALVEAEHRHDVLVRRERRGQGWVVAEAQIAPQPEDPDRRAARHRGQLAAVRATRMTWFATVSRTSSARNPTAGPACSQNAH